MELSNPNIRILVIIFEEKAFFIFQEVKTSQLFLIFWEIETTKKVFIFHETELSYISGSHFPSLKKEKTHS